MTRSYKTRYFNSLEKLENSEKLRKTSRDHEKLRAEYDYWYMLPDGISKYFVKPENFLCDGFTSSYDMKEYQLQNAAEQLVSGEMSNISFDALFARIADYLNVAASYTKNYDTTSFFGSSIVLGKTASRIKNLNSSIWGASSQSVLLKLSGTTPDDLLQELSVKYEKYKSLRSSNRAVLSHGDLTLSNILWDQESNSIVLVDPKGVDYMYLDEYYDLAKLSQSILGKYDYILYGKYDLNLKYGTFDLHLNDDDLHKENVFKDYLEAKGINLELLRVYEASLFLSMVPLHLEDLQRVSALLINCKNILNSL